MDVLIFKGRLQSLLRMCDRFVMSEEPPHNKFPVPWRKWKHARPSESFSVVLPGAMAHQVLA